MGWKDLLQKKDDVLIAPWIKGRSLCHMERSWYIEGHLPREQGWYHFKLSGRIAKLDSDHPADLPFGPPADSFFSLHRGYLVGDRLIADDALQPFHLQQLASLSRKVFLIDPGLDRFVRIWAGPTSTPGPLIYHSQDIPLGPEPEVIRAFEDRADSIRGIKGVTPALEMAFRLECWQRSEAERIRAEQDKARREEEERLRKEQLRQEIVEKLGDGAGRREMAQIDFSEAARAALAVGGAEYLSHRGARARHEMIVRFRLDGRRFECTCDDRTLRIIDAGICLVDHHTGIKGDNQYTLESLPGVINQAIEDDVLVVFRHVD